MHQPRFNRKNSVLGINPYQVKFGEEEIIRKKEQRQYKEDLDYLCSLRQRFKSKDEQAKPSQEELPSIQDENINDKQYQYLLLRQLGEFNLKESINRRNQAIQNKKRLIDKETMILNEVKLEEGIEREKERKKKIDIQSALEIALQQHNDFKAQRNKRLMNEKQKDKSLSVDNRMFGDNYQKYKTKIEHYNTNIYNRVRDYNEYLNSQSKVNHPISFPLIKNDNELNKIIAEQKSNEKRLILKIKTPQEIEEEMKVAQREDDNLRQIKLNKQRSYKEVLDSQTLFKQRTRNVLNNEILNTNKSEPLIMPGYNHPNYPVFLKRKAFEPLKNAAFLFHDYSSQDINLGQSALKRNPIICPINDAKYNKYVLYDLQRLQRYSNHPKGNHFNTNSYNR